MQMVARHLSSQCLTTIFSTEVQNSSRYPTLFAKKSSSNKPKKGFGVDQSVSITPVKESQDISSRSEKFENVNPKIEKETSPEAIFSKYGISDGAKSQKAAKKKVAPEDRAFGESVLEKIPAKTQMQIDNILVVITFSALLFVLLSGIGISISATKLVYPSLEINEQLDQIITNFLSPAFTPALGFLLLCSSTFGLFKFAQISSSQTVYKE